MDIAALHLAPKVDGLPLEKLAGSKAFSEEVKIAEVSRQFEAVLLRQILGQARKTIFNSKLSDNSATTGIYQDMVTQQFAESISRSRSFGLARSLETQLTQQLLHAKSAETKPSTVQDGTNPPVHD